MPYFWVRHISKTQITHRQDKLNPKVKSCVMVRIKFERPSWWQINVRSLNYERNIKKFS
jgi:hypothetical protein